MVRTMYDGVNGDAAAIGAQAKPGDLVAGYGDGLYAWSGADWAHIAPGVIRVVIVVFASTNAGVILDCETGNCTPAQSVDWVLMRRAAGVDPTVYCNEKNLTTGWPAVRAAFQARGVREPHYWVANYDGVAVIPAGAVGKQYNDDLHIGTQWDVSVVADYWPGVDPPPRPPVPAVPEEDEMILTDIKGSSVVWALSGGLYWPVADVESVAAYRAAHITEVTITPAEHAAILAAVAASKPTIAATVPVTLSGSGTATVGG